MRNTDDINNLARAAYNVIETIEGMDYKDPDSQDILDREVADLYRVILEQGGVETGVRKFDPHDPEQVCDAIVDLGVRVRMLERFASRGAIWYEYSWGEIK